LKPLLRITAASFLVLALAACSGDDDEEPEETPVEEVEDAGGEGAGAAVVDYDEAVDEAPPAEETVDEGDEPPADGGGLVDDAADAEAPADEAADEDAADEDAAAGAEGDDVADGEDAPEDVADADVQEGFAAISTSPEDTLYMELECGRVVIAMRPDLAPLHVERIRTLTRADFYDGVIFHRVIDGFMAQTGDPTGTGRGGSNLPDLPAEFSPEPFERGTVGMARTQNPNSANSQFFIMFGRSPSLDGQYTVWGDVVAGMDCVDQVNRGEPPTNPDQILNMNVAADIQQETP